MTTALLNPDLRADAQRLHTVLRDLVRVYQFRDRDRICCHDLSVSQCHALEVLVQQGPLTLNELSGNLYLDKSTTSRVVDALERKKFLKKLTHPEDGRAVHLKATDTGQSIHQKITDGIIASEARLIADFDPEVRTAMIDLISRLGNAASKAVDTQGGTCCCIE